MGCVNDPPPVPPGTIGTSGNNTTDATTPSHDGGANNRDSDLPDSQFDSGPVAYKAVRGPIESVTRGTIEPAMSRRIVCSDNKFVTGLSLRAGTNADSQPGRAYTAGIAIDCADVRVQGTGVDLVDADQSTFVSTDETSTVSGVRACEAVSTGIDVKNFVSETEFLIREVRLQCGRPERTPDGTEIADESFTTFFEDGVCDALAKQITEEGGIAMCETTSISCPTGSALIGLELNAAGNVFTGIKAECAVVNLTALDR
jgi:hypothetical protein